MYEIGCDVTADFNFDVLNEQSIASGSQSVYDHHPHHHHLHNHHHPVYLSDLLKQVIITVTDKYCSVTT